MHDHTNISRMTRDVHNLITKYGYRTDNFSIDFKLNNQKSKYPTDNGRFEITMHVSEAQQSG